LEKTEYEALEKTMWLFRRNPEELEKEERELRILIIVNAENY
jgi:hypothetical protein